MRQGPHGLAVLSFQQSLALLSLLIKGEHDAAADHLKQGAVQLDDFISFAEQHRLQPTVFSLLDGSPLRQWLPQGWIGQLKAFSLRQWARQEALVRQLQRLSALLAAAGQEFMLLKGHYLAERFFGCIERRTFSDLDIFVRREHLTAVQRLLCSDGYVRKSTILLNEALTTRFTHAFDFAKTDVTLDLHWRLSAQLAHDFDYEAIWQQRQSYLLRNQPFLVLSDEYEVVFKLASIFKDMERGMARLRSFVDFYFILRQVSPALDWTAFVEHRKREKLRRISVNVLALFLDFFKCQDRFPELSGVLAREQGLVKAIPPGYHHVLIEAAPGALENKVWAAGIYECSRMWVFLWWLVSLPFRLAVYEPGKWARFKTKLRQLKERL